MSLTALKWREINLKSSKLLGNETIFDKKKTWSLKISAFLYFKFIQEIDAQTRPYSWKMSDNLVFTKEDVHENQLFCLGLDTLIEGRAFLGFAESFENF